MGMAMAAKKEIISIHSGHTRARVPSTRPPISFWGEWEELQREARCGAMAERSKIVSITMKWSQVAKRLSYHHRIQFRKRKRPTQIPHHLFVLEITLVQGCYSRQPPLDRKSLLRALECQNSHTGWLTKRLNEHRKPAKATVMASISFLPLMWGYPEEAGPKVGRVGKK